MRPWHIWWSALACILGLVAGLNENAETLFQQALATNDYVYSVVNSNLSLFSGVRPYWTTVVITSTQPEHNCAVCHEFKKVLLSTAHRWLNAFPGEASLIFANIDLAEQSNLDLFRHLNITEVPHIGLLPPKLDESQERSQLGWEVLGSRLLMYKIPVGLHDERVNAFFEFLAQTLQVQVPVIEESQLVKFFKYFSFTFAAIIYIKRKGPSRLRTRSRKTMTSLFSILLVLVWVSGFQWTLENAVPFTAYGERGEMIFISGGTSYQFGFEVILITAVYASLAAVTVALIHLGRYKCSNTSRIPHNGIRDSLILASISALYLLYSVLMCIMKRKDHSYPFVTAAKLF